MIEWEDVGAPSDVMPWEETPVLDPGTPMCVDCGGPVARAGEICESCWVLVELDLAQATRGPRPE